MSQCTGVDKIWSALYSSGALAEREVENKIGHAFSTFAVVVLALGHFAKLADCGFATIYLILKHIMSHESQDSQYLGIKPALLCTWRSLSLARGRC